MSENRSGRAVLSPNEMRNSHPDSAAPAPYGCLHCTTAGSFKGDVSKMPRTCPTRTHDELAGDTSGYLGAERQALMRAADASPFKPDGTHRNRVEELAVKDRALDHHTVAALRSFTRSQIGEST